MKSAWLTLVTMICTAAETLGGCDMEHPAPAPVAAVSSNSHAKAGATRDHNLSDTDDRHDRADADRQLDHADLHAASDPHASCLCDIAIRSNGWCRACNVGYVAGLRVPSAKLFNTLDAHGHALDISTNDCVQCRDAAAHDGFCTSCGRGYVAGQTYFTALTWAVAQGEPVSTADLPCPQCRALLGRTGWCDDCRRGIVGNVAITNRAVFNRAAAEFHTLVNAIEKTKACDLCACAMVVHRTCPSCLISYTQ